MSDLVFHPDAFKELIPDGVKTMSDWINTEFKLSEEFLFKWTRWVDAIIMGTTEDTFEEFEK